MLHVMIAKTAKVKLKEDAFGLIISAVYNGDEVFEIIERDDGYTDAHSPMVYFSKFEEWRARF
jgi:hypothetical protein